MKKIFYYFLIAVFLTGCLPNGVRVPQSPLLSVLERKSGLIAYIGVDGNIYVTDQGLSATTQLTEDAKPPRSNSASAIVYQLPTWSLDGSQLGFIRLEQNDSKLTSELLIANIDDDTVKSVYTSEGAHPFYLYWSPDNSNLTFLSSTPMQQSMMLQSVSADGGQQLVLDSGTPFYWSWAPDGKTMIVHRGTGTQGSASRLSFLKLDTDVNEYSVDETPAAFQAPAWSPNGEFILLAQMNDDAREIILADSTGKPIKTIDTFNLNSAFAWSFDSERFAYIIGEEQMNAGTIGSLHVRNVNSDEEIVIDENVVSFFWSPDGEKLAYFVPFVSSPESEGDQSGTGQIINLQLNMLDIGTGESQPLFTFQPTQQFYSMIPYFDQYHQSTTIWSPDSNNLVLSFIATERGEPGIAVVAASGNLEPRFISSGAFAVWSWQ